jgi:uncharacterized membrane protein
METHHTHTTHETHPHASHSGEKNIVMAVLAYLGILIIIPYLVARDEAFVRFHIRQGLVLVVLWVITWFVKVILFSSIIFIILIPVVSLVNLVLLVYVVLGIINVIQGTEKELPYIGKYSSYFKI